jgi:hypothetical protein
MASSNASDFVVEDNLDDGSSFAEIGMDVGKLIEKMQKMEVNKFSKFIFY